MRVGANTGKQWRRGGPVAREPSVGDGAARAGATEIRRSVRRADLKAVGEVRGALRELVRHHCRAETSDVAELLVTELVTNALVHTEQGAEVSVTLVAARLRVEVRDFNARRPTPYVTSADDGTHGRGLVLVQALADAWGVDPLARGRGKVVWFELEAPAPA